MITKGAQEKLLSNRASDIIPVSWEERGWAHILYIFKVILHHLIFQSPNYRLLHNRKPTVHLTSLKRGAVDDMAEKDMTLISPCTGPGNNHPRKGHSRGEPPFPPFSNSAKPGDWASLGKTSQ